VTIQCYQHILTASSFTVYMVPLCPTRPLPDRALISFPIICCQWACPLANSKTPNLKHRVIFHSWVTAENPAQSEAPSVISIRVYFLYDQSCILAVNPFRRTAPCHLSAADIQHKASDQVMDCTDKTCLVRFPELARYYCHSLSQGCENRLLASSCPSVCPHLSARLPLGGIREIWCEGLLWKYL
jgi:hypothetical protein